MTEFARYRCVSCGDRYKFPDTGGLKECISCHGVCKQVIE